MANEAKQLGVLTHGSWALSSGVNDWLCSEALPPGGTLHSGEGRYRGLLDSIPDIAYALDGTGRFTALNEAGQQFLGYREEDLLGRLFLDIVHPVDVPVVQDLTLRALATRSQKPPGLRCRLLPRGADEATWVALTTTLSYRDAGVAYEHGVARDISTLIAQEEEHRAFEMQVLQTQRVESLGVVAGAVIHDVNNLLMGVLGNADLALLELPPGSPAARRIRDLKLASVRLSDLTNLMLAYSGKGEFAVATVALSRVVQEMSHLLAVSIPKSVQIVFELAPELPPVEADVSQLRQVVMNLITNAAEATADEGGEVSVRTGLLGDADAASPWDEAGHVFLEVADNGCGMDEATKQRIFDPFFSTKVDGRGLGLAAVAGIVRHLGGEISVDTQLGRGSTFRAVFPACETFRAEKDAGMGQTAGWSGRGNVLVVDDDETARTVASSMLRKAGFEVVAVSGGMEAEERLSKYACETTLVLLDVTMPGMDGIETLSRIRSIAPDLPVVLASGYSEKEVSRRVAGGVPPGFLHKPYDYGTLLGEVQCALGGLSRQAKISGSQTAPVAK